MADQFKYDVFLSYSSEDAKLVEVLYDKLIKSKLRVFWSQEAMKEKLGDRWRNEIEIALRESRNLVLILTKTVTYNSFVISEFHRFDALKKASYQQRVFPVFGDGIDVSNNILSEFIKDYHSFNLNDNELHWKLIEKLGGSYSEFQRNIDMIAVEKESLEKELIVMKEEKLKLDERVKVLSDQVSDFRVREVTWKEERDALTRSLNISEYSVENIQRREDRLDERVATHIGEVERFNSEKGALKQKEEDLEAKILKMSDENKRLEEEKSELEKSKKIFNRNRMKSFIVNIIIYISYAVTLLTLGVTVYAYIREDNFTAWLQSVVS